MKLLDYTKENSNFVENFVKFCQIHSKFCQIYSKFYQNFAFFCKIQFQVYLNATMADENA